MGLEEWDRFGRYLGDRIVGNVDLRESMKNGWLFSKVVKEFGLSWWGCC